MSSVVVAQPPTGRQTARRHLVCRHLTVHTSTALRWTNHGHWKNHVSGSIGIFAGATQKGSKSVKKSGKGRANKGKARPWTKEDARHVRDLARLRKAPLSARRTAVEQLMRIEFEGAYVGLVNGSPKRTYSSKRGARANRQDDIADFSEVGLGDAVAAGEGLRGAGTLFDEALDPRDERMVTNLVNGVTRWRRKLDFFLSDLCDLRKADPSVTQVQFETAAPALPQVCMCVARRFCWLLKAEPQLPKANQLTLPIAGPFALKSPRGVGVCVSPLSIGAICSTLQILRIGAYELLECGMPVHVINEHVGLAKSGVNPGAAKFTNGVLRNLQRKISSGALPQPSKGSAADRLAIMASHPTWMVERWLDQFGLEATHALMAWNNRAPFHSIRLARSSVLSAQSALDMLVSSGVDAALSPYLPCDFIRINSGLQGLLSGRSTLPVGSFSVQDESAGLVVAALDPQPGELVLDCCAAPGGKALYIAERMGGQGKLVAMDVNGRRLRALSNSVQQRGLKPENVEVVECDLRNYSMDMKNHGKFDRVLLDAPCSGLGVLSKRADMRWRRSLGDLKTSIRLTHELMEAAARLVRVGGVLVYSTCTIDRKENFEPVERLLQSGAAGGTTEFELLPAASIPEDMCPNIAMETLPHVHGVDGAFAAKLRRIR